METLVSVIVPVYNVAPYLRDAIDSLINQTYRHLEIIIVDDGSTDGSGEICDENKYDPRVDVIHQENRGLSGARNMGLDRMTGDYVAFLDSDDIFLPDMISQMLEAIDLSQSDVVECNCNLFGTKGSRINPIIKREEILSSKEALNRLISGGISFSVCNKLYRSSLWNDIRFSQRHVYEDVDIMYKILEKSKSIHLIPQTLMRYREREGSICHSVTEENIQDFIWAYKGMWVYVANHIKEVFKSENVLIFQDTEGTGGNNHSAGGYSIIRFVCFDTR